LETQQTHKALLCALCQIVTHDNAANTVPALVWQVVGDDAILEGYNEAMERLTEGGVEGALGAVMSEFAGPTVLQHVLHCARTGEMVSYESVRAMRSGPGTYRLITTLYPVGDGRVVLYACPLERIAENAIGTCE